MRKGTKTWQKKKLIYKLYKNKRRDFANVVFKMRCFLVKLRKIADLPRLQDPRMLTAQV